MSGLIWIALLLGAMASAAAFWVHYREAGGCAILFRTPRAALLGVPNAALGLLLYAALAAGLVQEWPAWFLFLMTVPAVAMSAFLGWSLLSRKLQCRICWTGHFANIGLSVLLATRAFT
jgi:uncharacterized membrane protein